MLEHRERKVGEILARSIPGDEIWYYYVEPFLFGAARIAKTDGECVTSQWMYKHWWDATKALQDWDGVGDPPGPWVRRLAEGDNDFVRREDGEGG
jgi:hypothetical protein